MEFYRTSNWLWVFNQVWAILLTGTLAFSGVSSRLRNLAQRLGRRWFLTVGLYVVLYLAVVFVIDLPLSFYQGYLRLHAYGLSNQTFGKWFGDKLIALAVAMAVGFALTWVPYLVMARSPRRWWLYIGLLSVPFLFATMLVEPIWIDPLFNTFGPMKNKVLERSILALAERAGIERQPGLRGREERRYQGRQRLRDRCAQHQADRLVGYAARQARRARGAGGDGSRDGSLRAGPCGPVDPARLAGGTGRAVLRATGRGAG